MRSPQKRARLAGLIVGAASLLGVLLVAFVNLRREAPGPVSAVHGAIEELAGGTNCAACHGGWFGDMQQSCEKCHDDIGAQLVDRDGLHGGLDPALAKSCSTCHGEHHGSDFRLVNRLAFAQAGVPDPGAFDHGRVGFEMSGRHLELACVDCHQNAEVEVLPEGHKRYLELEQGCGSCHDNPHGGRMQLVCATCHTQETFQTRFVATHDRYLALTGPHAEVSCRECHVPGTDHELEAMTHRDDRPARKCGDCHDSPHGSAFIAGNAAATERSAKATCESCHPLELPAFTDERVTLDAAQHAHSGFPLSDQHDGLRCEQCHARELPFAERHPGRQRTDCQSCHGDPHGGQFATGPFAAGAAIAGGCVGCHAATRFAPHEFDLEHHARTGFALTGAHETLECSGCHPDPAAGEPRRFAGTPSRCEQCHRDAHLGKFANAVAPAAEPRGSCAACHGTSAFADVDVAAFHHERDAGFLLDGAHAQIECRDCHPGSAEPDELGRRFGRVVAIGATFAGCVTCHPDPHRGQFDRADLPAAIDGRTGCARCHDTASFRALPHGFAHGDFTGFELTGAHAEMRCVDCHALRDQPDENGRESLPAKGRECNDCHADPHAGQFERLGRTDCARCHKSPTSFRRLSFRHNLDSRFPLGEAHQKVPCADCHKLERFGANEAVRYKPLPTECVQCHGTDKPRRGR
ncbi:MAG: hypothetical protein KDE27_04515 [Planctomycetes bacterium]|nr:hypothetical protein [Planctomycetota bacterium]